MPPKSRGVIRFGCDRRAVLADIYNWVTEGFGAIQPVLRRTTRITRYSRFPFRSRGGPTVLFEVPLGEIPDCAKLRHN